MGFGGTKVAIFDKPDSGSDPNVLRLLMPDFLPNEGILTL